MIKEKHTSNISTSFKEFEQALYEAPIDILEKMDTPSFSIDCDEPGAFLEIKNWLTDVKKDAEYDVLDPLYVWDKTIVRCSGPCLAFSLLGIVEMISCYFGCCKDNKTKWMFGWLIVMFIAIAVQMKTYDMKNQL